MDVKWIHTSVRAIADCGSTREVVPSDETARGIPNAAMFPLGDSRLDLRSRRFGPHILLNLNLGCEMELVRYRWFRSLNWWCSGVDATGRSMVWMNAGSWTGWLAAAANPGKKRGGGVVGATRTIQNLRIEITNV